MSLTILDVELVDVRGGISDSGPNYQLVYQVHWSGTFNAVLLLYNTDSRLPHHLEGVAGDPNVYVSEIHFEKSEGDELISQGYINYVATCSAVSVTYNPNPLSRPPKINGGGSDVLETVSKDINGKPILNSAGEFYPQLPQRPIQGGEFTITRNEASNPATTMMNYSYTTNSSSWYGVQAGNAMLGKISYEKVTETVNGVQIVYYTVTYPIRLNVNGWNCQLIDNGYATLSTSGTTTATQSITDAMAVKPSMPSLLDGHGHTLAPGATAVVFPTGGYQINYQTNWSTLGLPNVFA